jgi:hypothetical protein
MIFASKGCWGPAGGAEPDRTASHTIKQPALFLKEKHMAKESKADKIKRFVDSLRVDQLELIEKLLGRTSTLKTLNSFFTKAFKKTLAISSRKGKARGCQQEIARMISEFTGVPFGKDEEIQSREMGQSGADVRLSARVMQLFPYGIECKDDKSWNIKSAIQQAVANTKPGLNWIVFHRQTDRNAEDRVDMVAVIDACHFFDMLKEMKVLRTRQKLLRRG